MPRTASQTFDSFFVAVAFLVIAFAIVRIAVATNRPTARPGQFSLASAFVATAFVAFACAAIRYVILNGEPVGQLLSAFPIPILFCGAIGTLRGRLRAWLGYGVAFDFALMGAMLVWLTFHSE